MLNILAWLRITISKEAIRSFACERLSYAKSGVKVPDVLQSIPNYAFRLNPILADSLTVELCVLTDRAANDNAIFCT